MTPPPTMTTLELDFGHAATIRFPACPVGGLDDASTCDPAQVLRDVRDGVVSAEAAERDYTVAIAKDGRSIDDTRTAALRAAME